VVVVPTGANVRATELSAGAVPDDPDITMTQAPGAPPQSTDRVKGV